MGGVVEPPTKFSKRGWGGGGLAGLQLLEGNCRKRGGGRFSGGGESLQFLRKNKIKSEIFNDKKVYKQKIFFSVITKNSGWEILTISYF